MAARIWFNHWFSSVYQIIRMIREGCGCDVEIVGSNRRESTVYKSLCDEWYVEMDECPDEAYAQYCLDFCREHRIDIFAPRRGLTAVAQRKDEFEAAGVKLLLGVDGSMARILDDKAAAYRFISDAGLGWTPEYRIAYSAEEFRRYYGELKREDERICYKLTQDEGARSFRVIDGRVCQARALMEKPGSKVTLEHALMIMDGYDFSIPVLMMPYLEGPEISVDCLQTSRGKLIIPRIKKAGRYSEVRFDAPVMKACAALMDCIHTCGPVNIQLRMHKGELWLLEINPRLSGGIQLSCEAAGVNLPAIAVNELLGFDMPWEQPAFESRRVAHVETPVRLV